MNRLFELDTGFQVRLAACVFLLIAFSVSIPGFASIANAASITENIGLIALVGTGVMLTMVVGQLDLSVASAATVSAITALLLAESSLVLGVVAALAVAAIYGMVIGYIIDKTGVNSLVLTVCMLIALRGLALIMVPKRPAILPDHLFWVSDALVAQWGPVTLLGLIGFAIVIVVGCLMRYAKLGLSMYAVGGNVERARGSGVSTTPVYMVAFAGSAVLGATAGILAALRSGSASSIGFDGFLLAGITVAVVGGVPLEGGRGTIINVLLGALVLRLISAAVSLGGIPGSFESIVVGGILLIMLLLDYRLRRRGRQSHAHT